MAGRLDGRVAFITGAGSGIGRACCLRFAEEGAAVCAADLNLEAAAETVRQIEATGGRALAHELDTTDEGATEAAVMRCAAELGGLDVSVAAAGILVPQPGSDRRRSEPLPT